MSIVSARGRKMYTISEKTRANIERVVGISVDKLSNMNAKEERSWIEDKKKERLSFSKKRRYGIIGRGNPLISRRKIRTAEDLDRKSKQFFGI